MWFQVLRLLRESHCWHTEKNLGRKQDEAFKCFLFSSPHYSLFFALRNHSLEWDSGKIYDWIGGNPRGGSPVPTPEPSRRSWWANRNFYRNKVERLCPAGENRGDWGEYRGALSDKDSITEIKLIKSLLFIFTIVILNNVRNQVPFPDRNIFLV